MSVISCKEHITHNKVRTDDHGTNLLQKVTIAIATVTVWRLSRASLLSQ